MGWSKQTALIHAGPDISVSRKFLNKADLKEVTKVLKVHSSGCAYFAKQFPQVGKLWFKNSTVVGHIIKLLFILMETCVHKRQRQYKYQWYSHTNFVPGVTQGNGKAKSVKDFIFLFLWLVLIKRGTVSPKFPCVTSGGKVLLWPPLNSNKVFGRVVWRSCRRTSRMKLFYKNRQWP